MSDIIHAQLIQECPHPERKDVDSSKYDGEKGAAGKCVVCGHIL